MEPLAVYEWTEDMQRVYDMAVLETQYPHLHDAFVVWYGHLMHSEFPQA